MIINRGRDGKIQSRPFEDRFSEQLVNSDRLDSGCLIWNGAKAGSGLYPVIRDWDNRQRRVSRILLEMFVGAQDNKLACHSCDTPACINISHLYWGTPKENMEDMVSKGRANIPKGEHLKKIVKAVKERFSNEEYRKNFSKDMKRNSKGQFLKKGFRDEEDMSE